ETARCGTRRIPRTRPWSGAPLLFPLVADAAALSLSSDLPPRRAALGAAELLAARDPRVGGDGPGPAARGAALSLAGPRHHGGGQPLVGYDALVVGAGPGGGAAGVRLGGADLRQL